MKLPEIEHADRYTGLYVVDFADHCAVGFVAEEVAELLESEKYQHIHVYKIHNASPDGTLELKGIRNDLFQLEAGMLFYANNEQTAREDFQRLIACCKQASPPARAVVHLARCNPDACLTALIYPAEYDDSFSRWLLDCRYRTAGAVEAGSGAIDRYYASEPAILDKQQLFNSTSVIFSGEDLTAATKRAIVR